MNLFTVFSCYNYDLQCFSVGSTDREERGMCEVVGKWCMIFKHAFLQTYLYICVFHTVYIQCNQLASESSCALYQSIFHRRVAWWELLSQESNTVSCSSMYGHSKHVNPYVEVNAVVELSCCGNSFLMHSEQSLSEFYGKMHSGKVRETLEEKFGEKHLIFGAF